LGCLISAGLFAGPAQADNTCKSIRFGIGDAYQVRVEVTASGSRMKAVPYVVIPAEPLDTGTPSAERGEETLKSPAGRISAPGEGAAPREGSENISYSGLSRLLADVRKATREKKRSVQRSLPEL